MTRAEYVETFEPPATPKAAGRLGFRCGRGEAFRLTFEEFFANDPEPRTAFWSRHELWKAYRAGVAAGRAARPVAA